MTEQQSPRSGPLRNWAVLFGVAAAVIALDQFTKALVTANLAIGETWAPIPALADFFAITRSLNKGAALGIFPWAGDLFLIVAIVMMIGIVIFYRRIKPGQWLERISLGLLLGGAAGNAIDRIRLGYVVDFVHLQLRPIISNVSNIADHAIVVAILILIIVQWRNGKNVQPETRNEDASTLPQE
jgi:signal peptidase II